MSSHETAVRLCECPRCLSLFPVTFRLSLTEKEGEGEVLDILHRFCPWDGTSLRPLEGRELPEERYRLEEILGGGGFASVYLAKEVGPQGRVTKAVKVFLPDPQVVREAFASEGKHLRAYFPGTVARADRLLEEARRMADLPADRCTNLPRVDIPRRDPWPHFAMEYLRGEPLDGVLRRKGRLPWREALPYLRGVAQGLSALHGVGEKSFHGDLKPSNIIVLSGDVDREENRIKLLDFGLSGVMRRDVSHRVTVRRREPGEKSRGEPAPSVGAPPVGGTPEYLAPEAFDPSAPKGRSSDFYAFGILLFEVLTGRLPFREPQGSDIWAAWSAAHRSKNPEPLKAAPARLRRLYRRCLAKDPEGRPADAEEILKALRPPLTVAQKLKRAAAVMSLLAITAVSLYVGRSLVKEELELDRVSNIPLTPFGKSSEPLLFYTRGATTIDFCVKGKGTDTYTIPERDGKPSVTPSGCKWFTWDGKSSADPTQDPGPKLAIEAPTEKKEKNQFKLVFPILPKPEGGDRYYVCTFSLRGDCRRSGSWLKTGYFKYHAVWLYDTEVLGFTQICIVPLDSTTEEQGYTIDARDEKALCIPGKVQLNVGVNGVLPDEEIRKLEKSIDVRDLTIVSWHPQLSYRFNEAEWRTAQRPPFQILIPKDARTLDLTLKDPSGRVSKEIKIDLRPPPPLGNWPESQRLEAEDRETDLYRFSIPAERLLWRIEVTRDGAPVTPEYFLGDEKLATVLQRPGNEMYTMKLPRSPNEKPQTFVVKFWTNVVGEEVIQRTLKSARYTERFDLTVLAKGLDGKEGEVATALVKGRANYLRVRPSRLEVSANDGRPLESVMIESFEARPRDGGARWCCNLDDAVLNCPWELEIAAAEFSKRGRREHWSATVLLDEERPQIEFPADSLREWRLDLELIDRGAGIDVGTIEVTLKHKQSAEDPGRDLAEISDYTLNIEENGTKRVTASVVLKTDTKGVFLIDHVLEGSIKVEDLAGWPSEKQFMRVVEPRPKVEWKGIPWRLLRRNGHDPVYVSKYEISNQQYWDNYLKDLGESEREHRGPKNEHWNGLDEPPIEKRDLPVYCISVNTARAFARHLAARLPDKDEWRSLWDEPTQTECQDYYKKLTSAKGHAFSIGLLPVTEAPELLKENWGESFFHVLGNVPELVEDKPDPRFVGGGFQNMREGEIDVWPKTTRGAIKNEMVLADGVYAWDLAKYGFGIRLAKDIPRGYDARMYDDFYQAIVWLRTPGGE